MAMKDFLKNALLISVTILLMLGAGEFAAGKITNWPMENAFSLEGKDNRDIPYNRNISAVKVVRGGQGTYEYAVEINGYGLRDHEYPLDPEAGVLRIAVVGDSNTFGLGVDMEDTYVKRLEVLLARMRGRKIEVMNFGAAGMGTGDEFELIKKKVLAYKPDIILLQMDPNDTESVEQIKNTDRYLNRAILALKGRRSATLRLLKVQLEKYKYSRYMAKITPAEEYANVSVPLKGIIKLCGALHIKFGVIKYDPGYEKDSFNRVFDELRRERVPVLDLAKSKFGRLPFAAKYVNGGIDPRSGRAMDAHASKYGNQVIAAEIAEFLIALPGYL